MKKLLNEVNLSGKKYNKWREFSVISKKRAKKLPRVRPIAKDCNS